jgi:hypothetical protein
MALLLYKAGVSVKVYAQNLGKLRRGSCKELGTAFAINHRKCLILPFLTLSTIQHHAMLDHLSFTMPHCIVVFVIVNC